MNIIDILFGKFVDINIEAGESNYYQPTKVNRSNKPCFKRKDYYYYLKGTTFRKDNWGNEKYSHDKDYNCDIFGVTKTGEPIILYERNGKKVRYPRIKHLFKVKPNKGYNGLNKISAIVSKNDTLLHQIENEIEELRASKENYVQAGLEDQYTKTFDVLMLNKSLVLSRKETIELAYIKAKSSYKKIEEIQSFLDNLSKRESRIKELSIVNLELHSQTASALQLIDNHTNDISTLLNICNGVQPLMDEHKVLQIKEALKLTEADFKSVFNQYELVS